VKQLEQFLAYPAEDRQRQLFPGAAKPKQLQLLTAKAKEELAEGRKRISRLAAARRALATPEGKPFVWDVDFAEIFSDEKDGFDIVIGNPPYVRQESIAPPLMPRDRITTAAKRAYKEKLQASLLAHVGNKLPPKLDKKADLYIYFFYHGLSLLNPEGTFCFITSNSWLDVGYGTQLQEFLLRNCHIKAIIDNSAKRSFRESDINTVISLFSAPVLRQADALEESARFVMFKVPFEDTLSTETFKLIGEMQQRVSTEQYRVFPRSQRFLLDEGWEYPEAYSEHQKRAYSFQVGSYRGNKWGGKYLRAPDIFWTVLEKGKGKLVRLGQIARIRRGFTTGCNHFFYLDENALSEWRIEPRFLRPVLKSPKEVTAVYVRPGSLRTKLFCCDLPKSELRGTRALAYIEWGETQRSRGRQKQKAGIPWPELPTVSRRKFWYAIQMKEPGDFFCNRFFNERFFFCYAEGVVEDQTFYAGRLVKRDLASEFYMGVLNCTLAYLSASLLGRVALGQGVLQYAVYEMSDLLVLNPWSLPVSDRPEVERCFNALKDRRVERVDTEVQQKDRRALDEVLFDSIGLSQGERDAVYEAVIDLVESRLSKADSTG
ncbi:MAG: Eco57I restriction-modification methylase domain-containing protein, partial [Candidatus Brocadiae bacterium]|nr:Eco57I restriction-modification methylase domain-containing protein [Candidatus Brocadiia bacterium]